MKVIVLIRLLHDSYLWNGITYDSSGVYVDTLTNFYNCDSIATLVLTINDSSSSVINVTACENYVWDGSSI